MVTIQNPEQSTSDGGMCMTDVCAVLPASYARIGQDPPSQLMYVDFHTNQVGCSATNSSIEMVSKMC